MQKAGPSYLAQRKLFNHFLHKLGFEQHLILEEPEVDAPIAPLIEINFKVPYELMKMKVEEQKTPANMKAMLLKCFDHPKGLADTDSCLGSYKPGGDLKDLIINLLKEDRRMGNRPTPRVAGAKPHDTYADQFKSQVHAGKLKVPSKEFNDAVQGVLTEALTVMSAERKPPFTQAVAIERIDQAKKEYVLKKDVIQTFLMSNKSKVIDAFAQTGALSAAQIGHYFPSDSLKQLSDTWQDLLEYAFPPIP